MPGEPAPSWPLLPVRPACPPFDVCTLVRRRGDLLGRLSDAFDYGAPLAFGAAAWLASCRLMWVMRWIKADEDEATESDPVG